MCIVIKHVDITGLDCSSKQWCNDYYITSMKSLIALAIVLLILVISMYLIRIYHFGVPLFPMCPLQPPSNPNQQLGYQGVVQTDVNVLPDIT